MVVANVRSGKGHVRIAVCTAETFLKDTCQRSTEVRSAPGEVKVALDVPPGTWAVQAYLDEDDIKRISRNFLGIPTTGLGFSNDAPFRFGPPKFADAAFHHEPGGTRIRLTLRYF